MKAVIGFVLAFISGVLFMWQVAGYVMPPQPLLIHLDPAIAVMVGTNSGLTFCCNCKPISKTEN